MNFLHMAWLDFKGQRAAFKFEEFLLLETLYPFLTLIFYCVMAGFAYQTQNMTDWVVGNAFLLCTNVCIFSLGGSFTGERYYGRIRSIIVGETSKIKIIVEKGFFPCAVGIFTVLTGFVAGCLVFHVSLRDIPWGQMCLAFCVGMFAVMGFGLLLSTLGLLTDQMHFILNLVQYVLLIFCGTNFPITQLPRVMQVISYILPLTRSIEAARRLINGMEAATVTKLLLEEVCIGVIYITLASLVVKKAERVAIKKGTLELF